MASAASVPGRSGKNTAALVPSHVIFGSTEMTLEPRFMQSTTQWPYRPSELEMMGLLPHSTMHSGTFQRGSS